MINERGQISFLVIIVLAVVMFSVLLIVGGAQLYHSNAYYSSQEEKALALAEAGIDKAVATLNKTGGAWIGEGLGTSGIAIGNPGEGEYSVKITTKDAGTKIIEATGFLPDKVNSKVSRKVQIEVSKGIGISFVYGVQVGEGGLELRSGNTIKGSVYSNGNISVIESGNTNDIEGDAWVAGGASPIADQQTDCEGVNCIDYQFGKSISSENRLDIAQSFKPTLNENLNKVTMKIKKIGNPADAIVRVLGDNNGKPDKNQVLATGTLYSNLVTTSYGWIDTTFDLTPSITAETTYWLMINTSSNNSNYWSWQNDLAQSYNRGLPKFSPNWNTSNPSWTAFSGDLSFKVYMGGVATHLDGDDRLTVGGNVHANTIKDVSIDKDAYYQIISSSVVRGNSHPNSEDPPPKVFPISDANINEWKSMASAGGTIPGFSNCPSQILSQKINGSIDLVKCGNITVKSPIWITGDLILDNGNIFTLSNEYQGTSGVIIVDGKVVMKNNNHFKGTGVGNSLLMVLSNYNSKATGLPAIEIKNNGNSGVFYAGNGIIFPGNGNTFKELTAWKISLIQNSIVDYEQGLSSTLFSSGPSGSYSLIKGTYQVK